MLPGIFVDRLLNVNYNFSRLIISEQNQVLSRWENDELSLKQKFIVATKWMNSNK
jgi:hypothetical protein